MRKHHEETAPAAEPEVETPVTEPEVVVPAAESEVEPEQSVPEEVAPEEQPVEEETAPVEPEDEVIEAVTTLSHEIPTWDDVTEKFANWVSRGRTDGGATERSMIDVAINELVYYPEAQTTMKAWAAKQESPSGCTGWVAILREFVSLMRLYPYESIDA